MEPLEQSVIITKDTVNSTEDVIEKSIKSDIEIEENKISIFENDIIARTETLLAAQQKSLQQLNNNELDGLEHLMGISILPITEAQRQQARIQYPYLATVADTVKQEGLIDTFQNEREALRTKKTEHALALEKIAQRKLEAFVATLNYDAILAIENDDVPINQGHFLLTDLGSILRLRHNLAPTNIATASLEERYTTADAALFFIEEYTKRLQAQQIKESSPLKNPSPEQISEALDTIHSVPEIVKRIAFQNDLQGFISSNVVLDEVRVPFIIDKINAYITNNPNTLQENPYALIAIAKKIHDEEATLGNLYVRETWKDAISIDKIYQILEKKEHHDAQLNETHATTAVDTIMERYRAIFGQKPYGRLESVAIAKEEYFIGLLSTIGEESNPMIPMDERVLRSQLVALHYLFSGGGIENLYKKYIASLDTTPEQITPFHEKKIKAELAMSFLTRNEKRNKEYLFQDDPDAPTIGFEYEFDEALQVLISDMLYKLPEAYEKGEKFLQNFPDHLTNERQIVENYLALLKKRMNTTDWILTGEPQKKSTSQLPVLKAHLKEFQETPTASVLISKLGTFEEDKTHVYREIITTPSNSYRLQQRELIQTLLTTGMKDVDLNMHITVGNIELSPNRPEASDILPLIQAADLFGKKISPEQIDRVITDKKLLTEETFWKCTYFDNQLYYLPHHFVRNSQDMKHYNNTRKKSGYELRSFADEFANPNQYSNRIRMIKFVDLANRAIATGQKAEAMKTDTDVQLNFAWKNLTNSWRTVLNDANIDYLPLTQRFAEVEIIRTSDEERKLNYITPDQYSYFLARLAVEAKRNPDFAIKTRKLMTEFNHQTRILLGDKTNQQEKNMVFNNT